MLGTPLLLFILNIIQLFNNIEIPGELKTVFPLTTYMPVTPSLQANSNQFIASEWTTK